MSDKIFNFLKARCGLVFAFFASFILVSLGLVVVVDVLNFNNLRDTLLGDQDVPFLWYHWFLSPVENPIQWITLGLVVAMFATNAFSARRRDDRRGWWFWAALTVGAVLMVLEDSLDVRHELRKVVNRAVGEHSYGIFSTLMELGYFALLGAVLLFAVVRYRRYFWRFVTTRRYLLAGFVFYAVAVGSSWLGSAFRDQTEFRDLYTLVGDRVGRWIFSLNDESLRLFVDVTERAGELEMAPLPFYLMDRVWEESVELLGAAALLTAGVAFWFEYRDDSADPEAPGEVDGETDS